MNTKQRTVRFATAVEVIPKIYHCSFTTTTTTTMTTEQHNHENNISDCDDDPIVSTSTNRSAWNSTEVSFFTHHRSLLRQLNIEMTPEQLLKEILIPDSLFSWNDDVDDDDEQQGSEINLFYVQNLSQAVQDILA